MRQRFHAGVGAVALVLREHFRVALRLRHADRHDFVLELARFPCVRCALLAAHGVGVGLLARDGVFLGEVLRCFDHSGNVAEAPLGLRALAAALQPVVQRHRARPLAPAHVGGVVLDVAHALDAAGEDHVGGAGLHHHGRVEHRLQPAAAAAVELVAGNFDRQVRLQHRIAPDAGRLAVGVGLGDDDIVELHGVQAGALDQRLDHRRDHFLDRNGAQGPSIYTDCGAKRGHDGCSSHAHSPLGLVDAVPAHPGDDLRNWEKSNDTAFRWHPAFR